MSAIPDVSEETQAILDGLKKEFGVSTNTEVLKEALRRAKRTANGLSEVTFLEGGGATSSGLQSSGRSKKPAFTPPPQSPDQACGGESTLSPGWLAKELASATAEFDAMPEGGLKDSIRRFVSESVALAPRPAPADAVKVLVEALEPFAEKAPHADASKDYEMIAIPTTRTAVRAAAAALSDPRVIAAQSADPWMPIANAKALIDPSKPVWTKGGMPVARLTWLPAPHSVWVGYDPEGNPWLWHSGDGRQGCDAYSLTNVEPTTGSRRDGSRS